ncbi:MAG TPA: hypothetical protein VFH24_05600 [Gemmatimonadales bacterium]|nr:hypothetical protein [Gemmatimonadales bacterium]
MTWRTLILFIAVVSLVGAVYETNGVHPSPLAATLMQLAPPLAAALWVEADARRLRRVPCYEFGAFVLFAWLLAIPGYCFWSRGRSGWRAALALLGLIFAPSLIAGIAVLIFAPERF